MSKKIEMLMPKMGESIMEAKVLSWWKKVGDKIEIDETIAEVATDKVDTELPSMVAGILHQIIVPEGEMAMVGQPMCIILVEAEGDTIEQSKNDETIQDFVEKELFEIEERLNFEKEEVKTLEKIELKSDSNQFFSPLVLNIAKQESISMLELAQISGTGLANRVTKHDLFSYLNNRILEKPSPKTDPKIVPKSTDSQIGQADEIVEMDRMRKIISERMLSSQSISAHVSSFIETDMTILSKWRDKSKGRFEAKFNEKLTFTPLLIQAVVKAIIDFPMINIQVNGQNIIKKGAINIGMAVALPNGNLIVPVIHNANQYDLAGLTQKVNDLSKRARENKLKPDDLEGGTYTISNIGTFGNLMGTPIIVQPQVAIMAFGAIVKKPAVIETPDGDLIGIRQKMFISHSYDHRVVDGQLGGLFLKRVSDYLEGFDGMQEV